MAGGELDQMVVAADVQNKLVGDQFFYGKLIVTEYRLAGRLQRGKRKARTLKTFGYTEIVGNFFFFF